MMIARCNKHNAATARPAYIDFASSGCACVGIWEVTRLCSYNSRGSEMWETRPTITSLEDPRTTNSQQSVRESDDVTTRTQRELLNYTTMWKQFINTWPESQENTNYDFVVSCTLAAEPRRPLTMAALLSGRAQLDDCLNVGCTQRTVWNDNHSLPDTHYIFVNSSGPRKDKYIFVSDWSKKTRSIFDLKQQQSSLTASHMFGWCACINLQHSHHTIGYNGRTVHILHCWETGE